MQFERQFFNDYYIIPEKELMTGVLYYDSTDKYAHILLNYIGAIKHHNMRLLSGKDVEENIHRIIHLELAMHHIIMGSYEMWEITTKDTKRGKFSR